MASRTAVEAVDTFAGPLEAALACVIQPHIHRDRLQIDALLVLSLQQRTANLKRTGHLPDLYFDFFLGYRILHDRNDRVKGPYWVETQSWTYNILDNDRHDVLTYHWTPRDQHHSEPHLHVGAVMLDSSGHELGKSFSKLHIAIGPVSVQRVVRMLIEEFDVQPLNADWDEVLVVSDSASI